MSNNLDSSRNQKLLSVLNSNSLLYKFELHEESSIQKTTKNANCLKLISSKPKWLPIMIICFLALATTFFLISTIVSATYYAASLTIPYYSGNQTVGKPCTTTSNCQLNAYCYISSSTRTGICTCINTCYFDTSSASCLQSLTFNKTCTSTDQCLSTAYLTCISNVCQCQSTQFWNITASECQSKKAPLAICQTGWNDCPSNSICTNTYPLYIYGLFACICTNGFYFNTNTGLCQLVQLVGSTCSYDYQCVSNAICLASSTSSTSVCVCDSQYYNNGGYCSYKTQTFGTSCTIIDQCNLIQNNLRCINSVCKCDTTLETWDSVLSKCVPLSRYGSTCANVSNCLTGYNFVCQAPLAGGTRLACLCPSTMYYNVVTGSCTVSSLYNVQCSSRLECSNPNLMICATSGGVTKRCLCIPNFSYLNTATSTCLQKKAINSTCTYDYECFDYLGFQCVSSRCGCSNYTKYYDSVSSQCLWLKRTRDTCSGSSQCASGNCCSNKYCC